MQTFINVERMLYDKMSTWGSDWALGLVLLWLKLVIVIINILTVVICILNQLIQINNR